jgi:anti-sigma regulatory factor (Ser/Thr protein kinase)
MAGRVTEHDEKAGAILGCPKRGLGTGLGAVQAMTDSLHIENRAHGGLRVVTCKWLRDPD